MVHCLPRPYLGNISRQGLNNIPTFSCSAAISFGSSLLDTGYWIDYHNDHSTCSGGVPIPIWDLAIGSKHHAQWTLDGAEKTLKKFLQDRKFQKFAVQQMAKGAWRWTSTNPFACRRNPHCSTTLSAFIPMTVASKNTIKFANLKSDFENS